MLQPRPGMYRSSSQRARSPAGMIQMASAQGVGSANSNVIELSAIVLHPNPESTNPAVGSSAPQAQVKDIKAGDIHKATVISSQSTSSGSSSIQAAAISNSTNNPQAVQQNGINGEGLLHNVLESRKEWKSEDDNTILKLICQTRGCSKLISMAALRNRRINQLANLFLMFTSIAAFIFAAVEVHMYLSDQAINSWIFYTVIGLIGSNTVVSILRALFLIPGNSSCYIELHLAFRNLYQRMHNLAATPIAKRTDPLSVLTQFELKYQDLRRSMDTCNILFGNTREYKNIIKDLKCSAEEKAAYLSVFEWEGHGKIFV
jgi:hypothetical protein